MMAYKKMTEPRISYDREAGRGWVQMGRSRKILWTSQMLSDLRAFYPTTKNEELAGMLGVGQRTMVRKARELGLEKDEAWLKGMWNEHRMMAQMMSRALGYPGCFQKGVRANPSGEFKKGHKESEEVKAKRCASMRRWYMSHRSDAREKGLKSWETRLANGTAYPDEETRRKMSESQKRWNREHPGERKRMQRAAWERKRKVV